MKKQNVRTISLIVCTFTYLLVGAAVFDALESETEKRRWEALQSVEDRIIRKYNISQEDFKVMETVVLKSEPHKAGQQWKFTGAFYYATTVLTTIGYGHSTPTTRGGKLFTMCYAIVGIPLGLVMFQSIGERVNRLSSFVIQAVRTSLRCKRTVASEVDLICVVTTLSSLTIAGGAAAFSRFEGWSYFDSVYYCFITLTTIGFGDMVALQKDNALNRKPEYVMFALIFILFGLAIVAASLNLLVLRFVTMNTEDERRDEAQAMQALQVAVKLEGDVITSNGSILSGYEGQDGQSLNGTNTSSMCSCRCICLNGNRHKKHQYKLRRSPTHIRHLLPEVVPMQDLNYDTQSMHTIGALNGSGIMTGSHLGMGMGMGMGLDVVDDTENRSPHKPPHKLLKRNVSLLSFRI
ncbi:two pore potassium channel protein sup-9 isoform X2 [Drosophila mojavensis]|uniref:Two pore potassium channel protein sup-9 isoform X2 n=1 Tax=Drosophila arizonae TaxID=7263 RepID=A0ABM1PK31_DROAR|nr:PREDICTED: two pore potassium channel protein sup-9 isoform X2 [Drosophila arizonae]XP_043863969.1 two pore potassium channel protein sup-9 isoform X2 [Drosophila mojavensis]